MNRPILYIQILSTNQEVIKYYTEAALKTQSDDYTDSGFDLILSNNIDPKLKTQLLPLGIRCSPHFESGYFLYPRSSIYKTEIRLANSVGIIDQTYRGEIKAAVDINAFNYDIGTRLFQLCHPSLVPMKVYVIDELDATKRGEGGFGSTG